MKQNEKKKKSALVFISVEEADHAAVVVMLCISVWEVYSLNLALLLIILTWYILWFCSLPTVK
jgi:hypothetical protein